MHIRLIDDADDGGVDRNKAWRAGERCLSRTHTRNEVTDACLCAIHGDLTATFGLLLIVEWLNEKQCRAAKAVDFAARDDGADGSGQKHQASPLAVSPGP